MFILLAGCVSQRNMSATGPIKHIDPPPGSTVIGYEPITVFRGFDGSISLPGLEMIPIIGPILGKGIGIKIGLTDTVIAPKLQGRDPIPKYIPKHPLPPLNIKQTKQR